MIDADHPTVVEEPEIAPQRRRERRDAAAHRQRILEVASRLFGQFGVAAVSMHQIAQAAEIGQGTLYRRYANKGALCRDLMHEQQVVFAQELQAWLGTSAHSSALTQLDGVIVRTLHFVDESTALLETVVRTELRHDRCDLPHPDERMPPGQEHWFLWIHDLLEGLLRTAVARGEIASLDAPYTADMLLALMNPMYLRFQQSARGYDLDRIIAGIRHVFLHGMHALPGDATRPESDR